MDKPGTKGDVFELKLKDTWFKRNDIITTNGVNQFKVLSKPRRKWYHRLLQFITFGLYKASWKYKVKYLKR